MINRTANLHMSLYRQRGYGYAACKREFDRVLAACRSAPLGRVRVTKIAIKEVGPDHSYDECRVLAMG